MRGLNSKGEWAGQGSEILQSDSEVNLGLATKLRGTLESVSLHLEGT